MIIDCHAHVYAFPKIKPREGATTFMSVDQQLEVMDAKGIDKAIILPINNAECASEFQSPGEVLYICEQHPGRFIPFFNLDPRLPRNPEMITVDDYLFYFNQYKELGFLGLGELTVRLPFDDPLMMKYFDAAQKVGFPITFHSILPDTNSYGLIDDIGLPRFEKVLKAFPDLKFFGHSPGFWSEISGDVDKQAKVGYSKDPVKPGGTLIRLFREYPQLYGDISAGSGLNALQRDPEHAWKFIDQFQDRLLLGLDYCSVVNDMQHIEWLTAAKDDGNISEQAYEKIMWQNINRVLNLGLE